MYCSSCGRQIADQAAFCPGCGTAVAQAAPAQPAARKFCPNCGAALDLSAPVCVKCGAGVPHKDFLTTLLLCIFLGLFGIHRFYTGNIGIGLAQLFTLGGCGIWWLVDVILIATGSYRDGSGHTLVGR
jgi:hypothetical protein